MSSDEKGRGERPMWLLVAGIVGVGSLAFYAWVGMHKEGKMAFWWAMMGESIGLFSAMFNAGALLAALWAVHLQRADSYEAGNATRRQLAVMAKQLAALVQAADAHREVAAAQALLAKSQSEANELATQQIAAEKFANSARESSVVALLRSEHAQRGNSIATILSSIAATHTAIEVAAVSSMNGGQVGSKLQKELGALHHRLQLEELGLADVDAAMKMADEDRDRRFNGTGA